MRRLLIGLIPLLFLAWCAPAHAQLLFGKKQKPNPAQRVPELIVIAKSDPDERKRAQAAEELRDYDTAVFTEIVPVLTDVLLHDKKVNVRLEALGSLTKIRPATAQTSKAIEKAAADDESLRVRLQAKAALPRYHLAAKSSAPAPASKGRTQTEEPPLASPKSSVPRPPLVVESQPPVVVPPVPPPARDPEVVPSDPPIPRPFPPTAAPPAKTPPPAGQGPSLFP